MANSRYEYLKEFQVNDRLTPNNWIVVRIDGCHFHRFSAEHTFEKPNDESALKLMNSCAVSLLEHFADMVFAYGVSDEYSFILSEATELYQRRKRKILSVIVSYFTSEYAMKWKEFFPHKELKGPPHFDGRVVCYPSMKIIQDYLAWRQVDCHINNQYNTCFWALVKSGKTEREAQAYLKGTQTNDKNELLSKQFGIDYNTLPAMFRKGSCVYKEKVKVMAKVDESGDPVQVKEMAKVDESGDPVKVDESGDPVQLKEMAKVDESVERSGMKVSVGHFDIVGSLFWDDHPYILQGRN